MSVSYVIDKRSGMSKVLHTYLDNNNQNAFSKNYARNLTTQEQAVVLELNHLHKKMGILICELIMIRALLIEQASEDLKYISNNINRINISRNWGHRR